MITFVWFFYGYCDKSLSVNLNDTTDFVFTNGGELSWLECLNVTISYSVVFNRVPAEESLYNGVCESPLPLPPSSAQCVCGNIPNCNQEDYLFTCVEEFTALKKGNRLINTHALSTHPSIQWTYTVNFVPGNIRYVSVTVDLMKSLRDDKHTFLK